MRAALALLVMSAPAPAQESTPALCRDGFDNDGDGQVDCADAECQQLPQCATTPTHQPLPPPMYAPPPGYGYTVPTPEPPYGLPNGISGAVLLAAGAAMLAGSALPWMQANCHGGDPILLTGSGCASDGARDVGITLSVIGGTALIAGIVLTPLGFTRFASWRRWRAARAGTTSY